MSQTHQSTSSTALVVGATGLAGRAVVRRLCVDNSRRWRILAASRRGVVPPGEAEGSGTVEGVALDLSDPDRVRRALLGQGVTHVFYAAQAGSNFHQGRTRNMHIGRMRLGLKIGRAVAPLYRIPGVHAVVYRFFSKVAGLLDPEDRNGRFMANLLSALIGQQHPLQHVSLITGGRLYGVHMGPGYHPAWSLPLHEESPTHPGPNWYRAVEDQLTATAAKHGFGYSIHRPHFIVGSGGRTPQNLGTALAVYGHLCQALGKPLIFPGGESIADVQIELSDAELIADQMIWAATDPRAEGAYNITNGAPVTWRELWQVLAGQLKLEPVFPAKPQNVERIIEPHGAGGQAWHALAATHDLVHKKVASVFPYEFLNQAFVADWDVCYSNDRACRDGFSKTVAMQDLWSRLFAEAAARRLVPPLS